MAADLSVTFTGLKFQNPFLLSSAPPTESDSNILRAFDAGWGGVVTKTIGLHPVANVAGPKTKFLRAEADSYHLSTQKRPDYGAALVVELGAHLRQAARLVDAANRRESSRRTRIGFSSPRSWPGPGNDRELRNWQTLATACQDAGADAFELNLSCPHMDRKDMGSNIGKDEGLISVVTQVVKEVAKVPVWCKITPSTTDIVAEARASFLGGADAITSSNTFPSIPLIDPDTLEFEVQRRRAGLERWSRRTGDPAAVAGQGVADDAGVSRSANSPASAASANSRTRSNYFLLGCGTVQVCTAAMLDHAIGPNIIKNLTAGLQAFLDRHAGDGWRSVEDFRGLRRDRIVTHSKIRRPDSKEYFGGHDAPEGYAAAEGSEKQVES